MRPASNPVKKLSWLKVSVEGRPQHLQMLLYFSENG